MISTCKVLGSLLAAMVAVSALFASSAAAEGKLATEGEVPVTLKAEETGTEPTKSAMTVTALGITFAKVVCKGLKYVAHKVPGEEEEGNQLIPHGATQVTLTPEYPTSCFTSVGMAQYSTTVELNGCDYVLKVGETTEEAESLLTYGAQSDIVCPGESEILVKVYELSDPEHKEEPWCTAHIPAQEDLNGAHLTAETTPSDIDVTQAFEGINGTLVGTGSHPIYCPSGSSAFTGDLDVDFTVKAYNAKDELVGVSITD